MGKLIKGMDLSELAEVEACGGEFFDGGVKKDGMAILAEYGMNLVRLRLWNDPYSKDGEPYGAGGCDLPCVMGLARRAKNLGVDWMLDFHYSDCWADPKKQRLPKAWEGKSAEELEQAVFDYSFSVVTVLRESGLLPEIVSVGNEVSNGLLWPFGKLPDYREMARLVSAGIKGVHKAVPGLPVMIHLDNGGDNQMYRNWFDAYLAAGGEDFSYIGLSYYPFWSGTVEELSRNMEDLALRYRKDLIIAEVSSGFTLEDYKEYEKLPETLRKGMATKPETVKKVPYPMTKEGQAQFMEDVMKALCRVPENRGKGFIYWGAAWIPVPGSQWATRAAIEYMKEKGPGGNEWANQALFDYDGNALPSLAAIRDFSGLS